jgi:hypothetical protein
MSEASAAATMTFFICALDKKPKDPEYESSYVGA